MLRLLSGVRQMNFALPPLTAGADASWAMQRMPAQTQRAAASFTVVAACSG